MRGETHELGASVGGEVVVVCDRAGAVGVVSLAGWSESGQAETAKSSNESSGLFEKIVKRIVGILISCTEV